MNKYLPIFILSFLFYSFANAQDFDVRKFTLKSDVILLYDQDSIASIENVITDYSIAQYGKLKAVTQTLKNSTGFNFTTTKFRYYVDKEDYFLVEEKGDCMGVVQPPYEGKRPKFYAMLFLQKKDKEYQVVGTVYHNYALENWQDLIKQVQSVSKLEKIKNLQERYTKSIDWFLDNNILPDQNFVKYYKQKGILKTDTAQLTEQQLARARGLFFNGNETFLDLIASTDQTEIRDYYLQKLKDIVFQSEYEFGDCLRFNRVVGMLTNDFNDNYDDLNRTLSDLLTKDELQNYEKRPIMNHLIDLIEKKTYKIGTFSASKL